MPQESLQIEDRVGSRADIRILRLTGPLILTNIFGFQSTVRADQSRALILDLSGVPLIDSAGIGALVGAYVNHQKDGRTLGLAGVTQRVRQALEITRVDTLFRFFNSTSEAEQAL